jgi:sugar lactone lactonase YvrE
MTELQTLTDGIAFGESPRWGPDGRLWFSDWGAGEVLAVDAGGGLEVMAHLGFASFQPFCIDWTPDERLLVISAPSQELLRRESDKSLVPHADLSGLGRGFWNEIVVDGRGNAYLNDVGFDLTASEQPAPGTIALLARGGPVRQVAEGVMFPNGMAVTADNSTLICAESYAGKLTAFDIAADGSLSNQRTWAELGDGVPDGICVDEEGAVWYADVPNKCCVRVREGGEVAETINHDLGCFACMLGGADRKTLFIVAREWRGPESMVDQKRTGQVLSTEVSTAGAGWP